MHVLARGRCYEGKGIQTKAQCDASCGKGPPPPSPTPPPGVNETTATMIWAGKQRQYMAVVPTDKPPTGLIIALDPVLGNALEYTCPTYAPIAVKTGAVLVCPAALLHPGTKGNGSMQTCWKAWDNYVST